MIAGQSIRLLPGTHVLPGGYLHAHITQDAAFCSSSPGQMAHDDICREDRQEPQKVQPFRKRFFTLYPNPSGGPVTIRVASYMQGEDLLAEVYAYDGRLVAWKSGRTRPYHHLCLSGLDTGVYFVRIHAGGQMAVQRLIIW